MSLNNIDLEELKGDFIAVNRFHKHNIEKYKGRITPKYYCFSDWRFFVGDAKAVFSEIIGYYRNTKFIINGKYYNQISLEDNDYSRIYGINSWNGVRFTNKLDLTKVIPLNFNVVHQL